MAQNPPSEYVPKPQAAQPPAPPQPLPPQPQGQFLPPQPGAPGSIRAIGDFIRAN